jgi:MoxR-like ATPase
VILTSNRTREIHDAVKRRCLYHWVDFPDAARELQILQRRVPGAGEALARRSWPSCRSCADRALQAARHRRDHRVDARADGAGRPGARPAGGQDTLGVLLKYQDDIARMQGSEAARLLEQVQRHRAQGSAR